MSESGQEATFLDRCGMSAKPPQAGMVDQSADVANGPIGDIPRSLPHVHFTLETDSPGIYKHIAGLSLGRSTTSRTEEPPWAINRAVEHGTRAQLRSVSSLPSSSGR